MEFDIILFFLNSFSLKHIGTYDMLNYIYLPFILHWANKVLNSSLKLQFQGPRITGLLQEQYIIELWEACLSF